MSREGCRDREEQRLVTLIGLLAGLLVLVTLLPLHRGHFWWVRIWDYPRAQIATLGILTIGGLLLLAGESWPTLVLAALLAGSIGFQLALILPYTVLWSVQGLEAEDPDDASTIRILLANVLMDNRDAEGLIRIVREERPDVLLAVETDDWWDERLSVLEERLPFTCHEPLANTYGLHFFSRLAIRDAEIRHVVEEDIPSVRAEIRLSSGPWIEFIGVHPKPPDINQDVAERDAELVLTGREAAESGLPSIVAGDLNDVAWSHTTRLFQRMSGLLDPRVGRGLYSTFNAKLPLLRWPLDHLFHDARFTVVEIRRLGFFGSDHFPVLVVLALQPEMAAGVEQPRPEPGDHEEARRRIRLVLPKLRARMRDFRRRHPRLRLRRRRSRWRRRRKDADQ
jgi:endonuclease/exonuclease/phosphatase (EEP) superfamily protein YafD